MTVPHCPPPSLTRKETVSGVRFGLKTLYLALGAAGLLASSAYAANLTDPDIPDNEDTSKSDFFYAVGDGDDSGSLTLTGGKTYAAGKRLHGGGLNTGNLQTTGLKITGENGATTFNGPAELRGGSDFKTASTSHIGRSEVVAKDVTLAASTAASYVFGGSYVNSGVNGATVTTDETYTHLTNVTGENLRVVGGSRTYYNTNTVVDVRKSTVIIEGNGKDAALVRWVIGGGLISGNSSQNGSWTKVGDTEVVIGHGVTVSQQVVGGNYLNWFGNAEVTGDTKVTIDGATVEGWVVGANFVDYGHNGELNGGAESSTEARLALAKDGSSSSVTVRNGSTVSHVIGGGAVNRWYNANPDMVFRSEAVATNVTVEDSTVLGHVVGGGFVFDQAEGALVDVRESINVTVSNSVVDGVITTDSLDGTDEGAPLLLETTAKAGKVSMRLTNVEAGSVLATKGTVELRAEDDGVMSVSMLDAADAVDVSFTANGAANDRAGGDLSKLFEVEAGDYDAEVRLEEGLVMGAVEGQIIDGEADPESFTYGTNSVMGNTLDLAAATMLSLNRMALSDLRTRLGDLRSTVGTQGIWARYDGGRLSGKRGFENDFQTFEAGADTQLRAPSVRVGGALSYTRSDADLLRGEAETDAFGLAAYAAWFGENGSFADLIARVANSESDLKVEGHTGTMENFAFSISGEIGRRFDLNRTFFVEPTAEFTFTHLSSDDMRLGRATYEIDGTESLVGRAGLLAGLELPQNKGSAYVRASALHEFAGDTDITGVTATGVRNAHSVDGKDSWVEYGLGFNYKLSAGAYVWADVERTAGGTVDEDWRASLGVRYAF